MLQKVRTDQNGSRRRVRPPKPPHPEHPCTKTGIHQNKQHQNVRIKHGTGGLSYAELRRKYLLLCYQKPESHHSMTRVRTTAGGFGKGVITGGLTTRCKVESLWNDKRKRKEVEDARRAGTRRLHLTLRTLRLLSSSSPSVLCRDTFCIRVI